MSSGKPKTKQQNFISFLILFKYRNCWWQGRIPCEIFGNGIGSSDMRCWKEEDYAHYKITASHLIVAQKLPEDPRNAEGAAYIPFITDEKSHFPWGRPCLSRKCDSGRQQMAVVGFQCQGGTASATACAR